MICTSNYFYVNMKAIYFICTQMQTLKLCSNRSHYLYFTMKLKIIWNSISSSSFKSRQELTFSYWDKFCHLFNFLFIPVLRKWVAQNSPFLIPIKPSNYMQPTGRHHLELLRVRTKVTTLMNKTIPLNWDTKFCLKNFHVLTH